MTYPKSEPWKRSRRSSAVNEIAQWHLVNSLEEFDLLVRNMDESTDDLVRWGDTDRPTHLPCLAHAYDQYMGGGYAGRFVFIYREEARLLVGGLA